MLRTGPRLRACAPWMAALLLGSALGACNGKNAPDVAPSDSGSADADAAPATLPLSTTGATTQTQAPPVTALPAGSTVGLRRLADRQQGYGWLDRAYYQEQAVEDAPPDYSFDEDGVQPWTWASGDGARVITEPVAGGYRTYYYDAGSQEPYLVRDPSYAYAYDNGALVAVFTPSGVMSDPVPGSPQAMYAARYYGRGSNLWHNAETGPHQSVNAYAWSDRRSDLSTQRGAWQKNITENPDWSAWNNAHRDTEQARWDDVRVQHQAAAQQFNNWQQQKFQGAPPQLYNGPPAPSHPDHTAAVVGGAIAAGVAATAAHAVLSHPAPHQTEAPVAPPHPGREPAPAPQHPAAAAAPQHHAAEPHASRPEPVQQAPRAAPHPVEHQAPHPAAPHPVEHLAARPAPQPEHKAPPKHAEPYADPKEHEHHER